MRLSRKARNDSLFQGLSVQKGSGGVQSDSEHQMMPDDIVSRTIHWRGWRLHSGGFQ